MTDESKRPSDRPPIALTMRQLEALGPEGTKSEWEKNPVVRLMVYLFLVELVVIVIIGVFFGA